MNRREKFKDSLFHYRRSVGLSRTKTIYRSLFYEITHREPKKYGNPNWIIFEIDSKENDDD